MSDIFTIHDFENEQQWLKGRMNGIGGSDASVTIGRNQMKETMYRIGEDVGTISGLPEFSFEAMEVYKKTLNLSQAIQKGQELADMAHADKYSPAFSKNATQIKTKYGTYKEKVSFEDYEAGKYDPKDSWMYSSFWYKNFDGMAYKTMLRQLISKWGIMSIDLQNAFENDMTFTDDQGKVNYPDQDTEPVMDVEVSEVVPDNQPASETAQPQQTDVASALFG